MPIATGKASMAMPNNGIQEQIQFLKTNEIVHLFCNEYDIEGGVTSHVCIYNIQNATWTNLLQVHILSSFSDL